MAFGELLRKLQDRRVLVDIRRDRMNVEEIGGYVVGMSDELVVVALVWNARRNGYTIFSRDDVTFLKWGTERQRAWEQIVPPPDEDPTLVDLDLADWRSAIASLEATGLLLSFCRERIDSQSFFPAKTFETTYDLIVGARIAPDGTEQSSFALKIDDITRIDIGGDYEEGLARLRLLH